MSDIGRILFYFCESKLHPGAGGGETYIDKPIQRNPISEYPLIRSGSVKGALRNHIKRSCPINEPDKLEWKKNFFYRTFGPPAKPGTDEPHPSDFGGALDFSDADILLFPVASYKGLFAWITCPEVIFNFCRHIERLGWTGQIETEIPLDENEASVSNKNINEYGQGEECRVTLKSVTFTTRKDYSDTIDTLAGYIKKSLPSSMTYNYLTSKLKDRIIILNNDVFRDYVVLYTEVITRNRIGETGTVEKGALWTEEYLPTNTILFGSVTTTEDNIKLIEQFERLSMERPLVQMGGNKTVGNGVVRFSSYEINVFNHKKTSEV